MIYTFYSYKGGVGRSMAVANVAEIMYGLGLRVLLVDFDLEAPGLERYFEDSNAELTPDDIEGKRGLIDLLVSYNSLRKMLRPESSDAPVFEQTLLADQLNGSIEKALNIELPKTSGNGETGSDGTAPELPFPVEPLESFVYQLYSKNDKGGELYILPAGRRARADRSDSGLDDSKLPQRDDEEFARYAERVRAFPWNDFYTQWDGQRFFEWFRTEAEKLADVVIIDSRTGVTETSGICTYHLADVVVMFVAPNKQNLVGTKMIGNSLVKPKLVTQGRHGRKLSLLFVPSRVDLGEKGEGDTFSKLFTAELDELLSTDLKFEDSAFVDLLIPYLPFYSFREDVAVRDIGSPIAIRMKKVYERLCLTLAKLDSAGGKLREKYDPKQFVDGNVAEQQNRKAETAFSKLTAGEQAAAQPVFFQLVRLAQLGEAGGDSPLRVNMQDFNADSQPIVTRLSEVGLLSVEKSQGSATETVQFAEDSLIENWNRLRDLLNRERDFLFWRQQIKSNIDQWNKNNRERFALLKGSALAEAKRQRSLHEAKLTDSENLYIERSLRYNVRQQITNIAVIVIAVLAVFGFGFYSWRQEKNKRQEDAAKRAQLVASYLDSGDQSIKSENFNAAIASFEQALNRDPDNVRALINLGKANALLGNSEKAFEYFNLALQRRPDYAETYAERALAYIAKGDHDAAINDLNNAIKLKPEYAEAYYFRGYAYQRKKDPDAAMNDYNLALLLRHDDYPEVFLARGKLYKDIYDSDRNNSKARDNAISDFGKAVTSTSIPAVRSQAEQLLVQLSGPSAQPSPTPNPPKVFIHYNDQNDESAVTEIADDIRGGARMFVEGVQPSLGFTTGDIRYYYPEDKGNVDTLIRTVNNRLKSQGRSLKIKPRFLGNYYKDVDRGSIEIWIPSLNSLTEPVPDESPSTRDTKSAAPALKRLSVRN